MVGKTTKINPVMLSKVDIASAPIVIKPTKTKNIDIIKALNTIFLTNIYTTAPNLICNF